MSRPFESHILSIAAIVCFKLKVTSIQKMRNKTINNIKAILFTIINMLSIRNLLSLKSIPLFVVSISF